MWWMHLWERLRRGTLVCHWVLLLAAFTTVFLPACGMGAGCTTADCTDALMVRAPTGGLARGDGVRLELCLDGACVTAESQLRVDKTGAVHSIDADASVLGGGANLEVWLNRGHLAVDVIATSSAGGGLAADGSRAMRLRVFKRGSPEPVVDTSAEVPFEKERPNGPRCEPVCWFAEVEVT